MSAPVSNGVLRTKLSDMKIGDYIKWGYTAFSTNVAGTLQEDTTGMSELPAVSTETGGGGYFYFIKWKQGLLVADRAIQCKISAQTINKAGYYEGSKYRLLSSEECDSICIDDFNGSGITVFKSLNKWTTGWDQKLNIVLLQNGKNEKNNEGTGEAGFNFTEVVNNTDNFSHRGTATALFLPCMEYIDSSKSTNIFY